MSITSLIKSGCPVLYILYTLYMIIIIMYNVSIYRALYKIHFTGLLYYYPVQIEELLEELEKERTKLHALEGEKKVRTIFSLEGGVADLGDIL